MKQLCYLAASAQQTRFDALFQELDIVATVYCASQINSLVAFIMREKTIVQQDFIVLDLTEANWSQEHILSAVQQLRRFAVSRLIFIAPAGDETVFLYGRLVSFRIDDLITLGPDVDLLEEMKQCLTRNDGSELDRRLSAMRNAMSTTAARRVAPLEIPPGMTLSIAVGGAMPRIGATTQAIGLCHYLKQLGFAPCLFDPERKLLDMLLPFYRDETQEHSDHVTIRGISFCTVKHQRFNAYIRDAGVIAEETKAVFRTADLSVLVGGTKPWELPALAAAMAGLKDCAAALVTIVTFAGEGDLESVGQYLGTHYASAPYAPDIWKPGPTSAYQATVLSCLQALCSGKRKG